MSNQELEPNNDVQVEETEQQPTDEHNQQEAQAAPEAAPQEHSNIRELRKTKEKQDRDLAEARRRIQELEAQKNETKLDDDDLVEYKHLKKELEQIRQESLATRIQAQYKDFDAVVNQDNLDKLSQEHPAIAQSVFDTKDKYSQAVAAYTLLKQFGIYKDDSQFATQKQNIQNNSSKPRPVNSISPQQGESPLTRANAFANGLTDDLKTELMKEMAAARKGY